MTRFATLTAIAAVGALTAGAGPALAGDPVQSRPGHLDAQVRAEAPNAAHAVTERGPGLVRRGKPTHGRIAADDAGVEPGDTEIAVQPTPK